MRNITLGLAAIFTFTLFSFSTLNVTEVVNYKVDVAASKLKWTGKKVTGEHLGTIKLSSGNLVVEGNKLKSGTFVIDVTTITVTDLTDKDKAGKLEGHLKSDDFFGTSKFPTAKFDITKATLVSGDKYTVSGNLTIKGKTEAIEFPATVKIDAAKVTAEGKISVDRSKFDVKYGSTSFFDGLGDKAIDNIFTLDVAIVANK